MRQTFFTVLGGVFLLLVLVKIFNVSYPVQIRVINTSEASEFSVNGTGKVDVVPDLAVVDAGISVANVTTPELAKSQITSVNNKIIAAVKALGVNKKDIETSTFNINPEYGNTETIRPLMQRSAVSEPAVNVVDSGARITGYNGTANVTIKLRNKDIAARVIQKVTEAGGTNVSGPRFTIDDRSVYLRQARSKAIADAREQAKELEKELGIKLGKITNMIETGVPYYSYDRGLGGVELNAKSSDLPVFEEGTDTVTSNVTLFFERK